MTEFDVIYADPPWRYDNGTPGREIERHYPTMTHEEICTLDVPAARNSVLFLWGVAPKLPEALEVIAAWGFTYRTGCRYPAPGWHVWGNQVDSSVADLPFDRFDPHADAAQGSLFGGEVA